MNSHGKSIVGTKRLSQAWKISVLFALSVLLVRSPESQAQEKKNLRIVSVSLSWNNQLPYRIAVAKGFFKDQGLALEQIFVRGGPTAIAVGRRPNLRPRRGVRRTKPRQMPARRVQQR